jgi:hypothetical protein
MGQEVKTMKKSSIQQQAKVSITQNPQGKKKPSDTSRKVHGQANPSSPRQDGRWEVDVVLQRLGLVVPAPHGVGGGQDGGTCIQGGLSSIGNNQVE